MAYLNLDSARLPVPDHESMSTPFPPKDSLHFIDNNIDEGTNACDLVFTNSTDSEFEVTENIPVLFS